MTAATLWQRHRGIAHNTAKGWFLPGADPSDVHQEALLALWIAARHHDPERGPFPPFAQLVIRRHLSSCVKHANRHGQRALTDAHRVLDNTVDPHTVHELAEARDTVRRFTAACHRLSRLERRAIIRCCNGDGPANKADDNALYRAKNKLRDQLALT